MELGTASELTLSVKCRTLTNGTIPPTDWVLPSQLTQIETPFYTHTQSLSPGLF